MAHLSFDLEEKVKKLMDGTSIFLTGVMTNGKSIKRKKIIASYDVLIGYCKDYDLFIAWNGFLHKRSECFTISEHMMKQYDDIAFDYGLYNNDRKLKEKKVLIPRKYIEQFCHNYIEYLMPNANDKGFSDAIWIWKDRIDIIINSENSQIERRRILRESYERNPAFRKKVLDNYHGKCAVCRTDITEILEAAHINAVANKGNDSLGNGICLCKNHHKLFDSNLLHFTNDYTFYSDELLNDDQYCYIANKYKGILLEPKVRGVFICPD